MACYYVSLYYRLRLLLQYTTLRLWTTLSVIVEWVNRYHNITQYVQLRSYETAAEHVYEEKWGHFDRAKPTFKLLLVSWTFYSFLKGFRSFNAKNLGSVGQRAAKWPTIKLWEWFDPGTTRIRADWFESGRGQMADFFLRPPYLTASNFDALWPTDPIFTLLKDLDSLKRYFKY